MSSPTVEELPSDSILSSDKTTIQHPLDSEEDSQFPEIINSEDRLESQEEDSQLPEKITDDKIESEEDSQFLEEVTSEDIQESEEDSQAPEQIINEDRLESEDNQFPEEITNEDRLEFEEDTQFLEQEDEFGEFTADAEEDFFALEPVSENSVHNEIVPNLFFPVSSEEDSKPWKNPEFSFLADKDQLHITPSRLKLYGDPRCLDLWQSLAFNEELGDVRFNNRNKLRWKQSLIRRYSLLAMGVPFNLDEGHVTQNGTNTSNLTSHEYAAKDVLTAAKRLDTTMAQSLCNVKTETLSTYSFADLQQFEAQMLQNIEEASLSMEHWRKELRSVEENQEMYQQMIANLVRHTHRSKTSISQTRLSRSDSITKK